MKQVNHIWAGETRYLLDSTDTSESDEQMLNVHFSKKVGVISSPMKRKGHAGLLSNNARKSSDNDDE